MASTFEEAGFGSSVISVPSGAEVFAYARRSPTSESARAQGLPELPVLVLLHGYPQNSSMWKEFIVQLPHEFDILIPDLPGYGNSVKEISPDGTSRNHSKREWGKDIIAVVDAIFGADKDVIPYGHDRGARLAYRMALDLPTRVAGIAVLDIVPTVHVWDAMQFYKGHEETKKSHHWVFLASPFPLPETMIAANPEFYYHFTLTGWIGTDAKDAKAGNAQWVKESIAPYLDPVRGKDRIAAACEDYRAGASHDIQHDLQSRINPANVTHSSSPPPPPRGIFPCPILVLSSVHLRRRFDVDGIWNGLGAPGNVSSFAVGGQGTGHFLVNECPEDVGEKTRAWLQQFKPAA